MTVGELFEKEKISIDFIYLNFEGNYWDACVNFLRDKWGTEIDDMSLKQAAWLTKILDDCVEKRIEG